jgi:ribulose-phosphate 3-epimerase
MTPLRPRLAPSILNADFTCLGDQVRQALRAGAEVIHFDVMDGHFVPNLTMGPMIAEAVAALTNPMGALLDVHLMVEAPERLIPAYAAAGAGNITVHVETCPHLHNTIQQIKALGVRAGVTLNPATPLETLSEILPEVDLVLVMSVNPGFGGQGYIPASTGRIRRLRRMLDEGGLEQVELEVDGGIKVENIAEAAGAGATLLVAGSAVFRGAGTIAESIAALEAALLAPGQQPHG